MKVYVVTETRGMTYEGDTYVRGAWSTREAANAHEARIRAADWPDDAEVIEIEIDSEVPQ